ncbi:MAG: branched-chain amino acid ABC transporter permease [Bacillota bacterium]|nr:branched-chain amino acid ABC transporter permease [Bacillota bacterium]
MRIHPRSTIFAGIAAAVVMPIFITNRYFMHLLTMALIYIILTLGLNLLVGISGQVSLGHAAFFGIGAYTAGILSTKLGLPFIVILPLGIFVPAIMGIFLGLPAARLKGPYLAMTTLGAGQIFQLLAVNLRGLTNGPLGITNIGPFSLFSFKADTMYKQYIVVLIITIVAMIAFYNIKEGPLGRAWRAIKDSSIASEAMGLNITWCNVLAFSICSAFAGVAGVLLSYYSTYISPDMFSLTLSFSLISIIVIGGRSSLLGTIIGALILTFMPEYLRSIGEWRHLVYSLMLIIIVLYSPGGFVEIINRLKNKVFNNGDLTRKAGDVGE